jgi:hypothetical protein
MNSLECLDSEPCCVSRHSGVQALQLQRPETKGHSRRAEPIVSGVPICPECTRHSHGGHTITESSRRFWSLKTGCEFSILIRDPEGGLPTVAGRRMASLKPCRLGAIAVAGIPARSVDFPVRCG